MELNYLEDYWPSADGLSPVNVIGTKLRDPITSGLTRRRMVAYINGRWHGNWKQSRKEAPDSA